MLLKTRKKVLAIALAGAMIAGLGSSYVPGSLNSVTAKAETKGDEGSDGLTAIDKLTVKSPDGKVSAKIWKNDNGKFYYSAYLNDTVVIQCSEFGLVTKDDDYSTGMELDEASVKVVAGIDDYDIFQGPVNHVNKEWNQLNFDLVKGDARITMNFRIANDGLAYRYQGDTDTTSDSESVAITSEKSSFTLPDSTTFWSTDHSATYEAGKYTERTMAQVKGGNITFSTPMLADTGSDGNGAWVLLSEASVYNNDDPYCASIFQTAAGKKAITVKFGVDLVGEDNPDNHKKTMDRRHNQIKEVDFTNKFETPWRAAIIGESLNNVINSTMISDLNPAAEGDFSWVKPGTSVWSWWSTSSDNIDYDSMIDYIDFCSEAGITYCLVDYGWEMWDNYEEKMRGLVEYANERNVGILVWYGVHKWDNPHIFDLDNEEDIEEQFAWCEDMGIKGVKVDYIESDSQFAMRNMYQIASIAAKHHLVVNYHGCTDPNGENRTFPNILSSEAVCGMEYFKWSDASAVDTLVTLPYTRNVIGSMEYTPALFSIPRSPATMGFMLSMCVNYESAVSTFSQSGYVYPGYNAFSLISDVPSTWDESVLLEGFPRESCIRARRNGENWYIGAMTVDAKNYNVSLDFLDKDVTYNAYIYRDNEDGSAIEVEKKLVTADDTLDFNLLANGGAAVKLTKNDPLKWTLYDNFTYYEAENATLAGKAKIKDGQAYISGKACVEGLGSGSANNVTFENIEVPEDGDYKLKLYIIAANKKNLTIEVNDEEVDTFNDVIGIAGDGGAVGAIRDYVDVSLHKGTNTIKLYTKSGQAPSIDRIAVSKALIDNAEVKLSQETYTYEGSECKPSVTVTREGKVLTEGTEYEVFYSNADKPGTASVYVTGINGYGGQLVKEYTINGKPVNPTDSTVTPGTTGNVTTSGNNGAVVTPGAGSTTSAPSNDTVKKPAKVKIKSLKAGKKQIKVSFKKVKGVSGYKITYSLNKKFKKAKTLNVNAKTKSKLIKKLKSGKTYYVKVRAYAKATGKKVYGAWSSVKKVKVK